MKKISSLITLLTLLPTAVLAAAETTIAPRADITSLAGLCGLIKDVAAWITVFGIIIAVIFVIWGGVQYTTAGGEEDTTSSAKKKIVGALIGIAILLLAYALVNIVGSFLGAGVLVTAT